MLLAGGLRGGPCNGPGARCSAAGTAQLRRARLSAVRRPGLGRHASASRLGNMLCGALRLGRGAALQLFVRRGPLCDLAARRRACSRACSDLRSDRQPRLASLMTLPVHTDHEARLLCHQSQRRAGLPRQVFRTPTSFRSARAALCESCTHHPAAGRPRQQARRAGRPRSTLPGPGPPPQPQGRPAPATPGRRWTPMPAAARPRGLHARPSHRGTAVGTITGFLL